MARSENNLTAVLQDTADAIKAKKGSEELICPRDFADEIEGIQPRDINGDPLVDGNAYIADGYSNLNNYGPISLGSTYYYGSSNFEVIDLPWNIISYISDGGSGHPWFDSANPPETGEKTTITSSGGDYDIFVKNEALIPSGTKEITENGDNIDVAAYSEVNVDVIPKDTDGNLLTNDMYVYYDGTFSHVLGSLIYVYTGGSGYKDINLDTGSTYTYEGGSDFTPYDDPTADLSENSIYRYIDNGFERAVIDEGSVLYAAGSTASGNSEYTSVNLDSGSYYLYSDSGNPFTTLTSLSYGNPGFYRFNGVYEFDEITGLNDTGLYYYYSGSNGCDSITLNPGSTYTYQGTSSFTPASGGAATLTYDSVDDTYIIEEVSNAEDLPYGLYDCGQSDSVKVTMEPIPRGGGQDTVIIWTPGSGYSVATTSCIIVDHDESVAQCSLPENVGDEEEISTMDGYTYILKRTA